MFRTPPLTCSANGAGTGRKPMRSRPGRIGYRYRNVATVTQGVTQGGPGDGLTHWGIRNLKRLKTTRPQ